MKVHSAIMHTVHFKWIKFFNKVCKRWQKGDRHLRTTIIFHILTILKPLEHANISSWIHHTASSKPSKTHLNFPIGLSSGKSSDFGKNFSLYDKNTVMILSFRTDRPGRIVQTQIRLLLEEQSDQGLHCLPFCLHRLDSLVYGRAT